MKSHAEDLAKLRQDHGLSTAAIGRLLGVDPSTVRRWLSPPERPTHRRCPAWAPELLAAKLKAKLTSPNR